MSYSLDFQKFNQLSKIISSKDYEVSDFVKQMRPEYIITNSIFLFAMLAF